MATDRIRVRDIDAKHWPAFESLACTMHAQAPGFSALDFNAHVLFETVDQLTNTSVGYARCVDRCGALAGALLGVVHRSFFGVDWVASDMGLFVYPDARGRGVARALVEDFLVWADHSGAKRVTLGNAAALDDETFVRALQRVGLTRSGSVMHVLT